jgi:hypothetical protein
MMPKSMALIHRSQARTQGLAIQAQKSPAKTDRSFRGPAQERGGNLSARKRAANGHSMDEGGLVRRGIRPEKGILELELDGAGWFFTTSSQEEVTFGHVNCDLVPG